MKRSLCWSHARRKLYEMCVALNSPIAAEAADRIDALYDIEREIRGLAPAARLTERKARAVPLLDELYRWLTDELARLPRSSALARVIRYTIKPQHWPALSYYCTDGRAEMSNNAAERSLRDVSVVSRNTACAPPRPLSRRSTMCASTSCARRQPDHRPMGAVWN